MDVSPSPSYQSFVPSEEAFVYHSDDSEIIGELHHVFGVSLTKVLTNLTSDDPVRRGNAVEDLSQCMIRCETGEFIRNCFIRSAGESPPIGLPDLFHDTLSRVKLFRMLVQHFPEMFSNHLTDENSDKRLKIMTIIVSVFKSADDMGYPFVFQALELTVFLMSYIMNMYKDRVTEVRFEWMKMGFIVLNTSLNTNGLREQVMQRFKSILMRDRSAEIRKEAVIAINDAVLCKSEFTFDKDLLLALIHRAGDRHPQIRIPALEAIQSVYHHIVTTDPDNEYRPKIASSLILLYKTSSCEEEKFTMEKALYQSLIRVNDDTPAVWAQNLSYILQYGVESAVSGIAAALNTGKTIRILFLKILIDLSEKNKSGLQHRIRQLAQFFDWHSDVASKLLKIFAAIDVHLFPGLLRLFSDPPDMTLAESAALLEQFVETSQGRDEEDIHYHFLIRSGVVLNVQELHISLIDIVDRHLAEGQNVNRISSILYFWFSVYDRTRETQQAQFLQSDT